MIDCETLRIRLRYRAHPARCATTGQMVAHRKLDRRRDDLCAGRLRTSVGCIVPVLGKLYCVCVHTRLSVRKRQSGPMLTGTPSITKNAARKSWPFEDARALAANTASTSSRAATRAMCKHARANKPTQPVTTTPAGVPHRGHDVAGLSYPVPQAEQTISVKIFRARRADHLPAGPVMASP